MILKDLIKKLKTYNPNARIFTIIFNKAYNFTITFGGDEGVTPKSAKNIFFYVDALYGNDQEK